MSGLVPLLFIIISAVIIFFGIHGVYAEFLRVHRLQTWTYATAHILSSRVTESSGYENGTTYNVEVEYQYEVDRSRYQRRASLMTAWGSTRKDAEAFCQSHSPGAEFPIVYNPKAENESESADQPQFRPESILILVSSIGIMTLIGLEIFVMK